MQGHFDHLLWRTIGIENVFYRIINGRKKKCCIFSLYGFRTACMTAAAMNGKMNDDQIICMSNHSSTSEVERYRRGHQNLLRAIEARREFKDFILNWKPDGPSSLRVLLPGEIDDGYDRYVFFFVFCLCTTKI